eukprot:4174337-Pleurochrysis_carterae.AAC.1
MVSDCARASGSSPPKGQRQDGPGSVHSHEQVVPLSGQWSRCVRATDEVYLSPEVTNPGSYELSEAGPGRFSFAGGEEVGGEAGAVRACDGWNLVSTRLARAGEPRTRWQTVLLRRPRRAALAGRSSSQVGLCSGGGGDGLDCGAGCAGREPTAARAGVRGVGFTGSGSTAVEATTGNGAGAEEVEAFCGRRRQRSGCVG